MKKRYTFLTCLALILTISFANAQSEDDPLHENHFRQVDPIETEFYRIEISDAHAQQAFCYLKFKVVNKTANYLLIKPDEFIYSFEHGLYTPSLRGYGVSRQTGELVIPPYESKFFVTKVTGSEDFHVKEFDLAIKGFYSISTGVEPVAPENFQLPAKQNSFDVDDFNINLTYLKQQTDETVAKFTCTYTGDDVAIIDPTRILVDTEKGEYANMYRRVPEKVLLKGDKLNFIARFVIPGRVLDMQFATMQIQWKDCFKEAKREALPGHKLKFIFDPELTEQGNFKPPY